MENFDVLSKYFFGGEAEAESEIRNNVFVSPSNIKEILSFNRARYKILLGSKGVGKSLLLNVLNESVLEENDISILLTPKDFDCESIAKKSTNSDKIFASYRQLLIAIGAKLGTYIDRVAITDTDVNLIRLSIDEGMTRPDMISRMSDFLPKLVPYASKIANSAKSIQSLSKKETILKKDIAESLKKNKKKLWILMDDVDQAAITGTANYDYSVCWALVAAIVDLANDFADIRCVLSVRTDIWHTMTVGKRLGSDRLDKIQSPDYLKFTEEEIQSIFNKRIALANKELSGFETQNITPFFESDKILLPGYSETTRSWSVWISKASRNRPRDMVHLVQELIQNSENSGKNKIDSDCAHKIMLPFAKTRIKNIETEYREICPQIKSVINDLSAKKIYDFLEIVEKIKGIISARSTKIDGKALQPGDNESAIFLLRILHMCNFINARNNINQDGTEYEHIIYDDRPFLVEIENWNEMQKYMWEIHPAFHQYVEDIKQSRKAII